MCLQTLACWTNNRMGGLFFFVSNYNENNAKRNVSLKRAKKRTKTQLIYYSKL